MAKRSSSARKPTTRAGSRSRSTTSATTAPPVTEGEPARPVEKRTSRPAERLTSVQQADYLHLLRQGASPAGACGRLGLDLDAVQRTLDDDPAFREQCEAIQQQLSQNVATRLYHSAMEGSVSAQTCYLRNVPPPEWHHAVGVATSDDDLEQLSDEELLERVHATCIDLPPEVAADLDPPAGAGILKRFAAGCVWRPTTRAGLPNSFSPGSRATSRPSTRHGCTWRDSMAFRHWRSQWHPALRRHWWTSE